MISVAYRNRTQSCTSARDNIRLKIVFNTTGTLTRTFVKLYFVEPII